MLLADTVCRSTFDNSSSSYHHLPLFWHLFLYHFISFSNSSFAPRSFVSIQTLQKVTKLLHSANNYRLNFNLSPSLAPQLLDVVIAGLSCSFKTSRISFSLGFHFCDSRFDSHRYQHAERPFACSVNKFWDIFYKT